MRRRWFTLLSVLSAVLIALVISACVFGWFVAWPALHSAPQHSYPATSVCQSPGSNSLTTDQHGQPVVVAVVHAYRYQHLVGGFRGQYTPTGPQTNVLCELRPRDGSLVRRLDIGLGDDLFYRLTQVGDTFFLSGYAGGASGDVSIFCAINAQNGATRWCYTLQAQGQLLAYVISPDGQTVSIRAPDTLVAFDAASGRQRWRIPLTMPFYVDTPLIQTSSGILTFTTTDSHPTSSSLPIAVALAPATGAILWRRQLGIMGPGFLNIATDGAVAYVEFLSLDNAGAPDQVMALRAADGAIEWDVPLLCPHAYTLFAAGGRLVYDEGCSVSGDGGNSPIPLVVAAAQASTGVPAWRFSFTDKVLEAEAPAISDGVIYIADLFGSYTGKAALEIYALRVGDGKVLWKVSQPLTRILIGSQALAVVNGVLCRTQYETNAMAIDGYSASTGALLWRVSYTGHERFADSTATPPITRNLWPAQFARLTVVMGGVE